MSSSKSLEDLLLTRADELRTPFYGGMELIPACNMHCDMCHIREDYDTCAGRLLSGDQWIAFAQDAFDHGVFSMVLSGGEPLLYPEFKQVYSAVQAMGLVVKVNTNATLIDDDWADFFAANPCRQLNITLYGSSNDTYARLCHNPRGFDQTMHALQLLQQRHVPFRLSVTVTNENYADLESIAAIASELGVSFIPTTYLFPPRQEHPDLNAFYAVRPSPEAAARARLLLTERMNPDYNRVYEARQMLKACTQRPINAFFKEGLPCRGGRSGFWIDWKGNLTACTTLRKPAVSILTTSFSDAWKQLTAVLDQIPRCEKCMHCRKQFFCHSCTAASICENGDSAVASDYLCRMTDEMLRILLSWLPAEDQDVFRYALHDAGIQL